MHFHSSHTDILTCRIASECHGEERNVNSITRECEYSVLPKCICVTVELCGQCFCVAMMRDAIEELTTCQPMHACAKCFLLNQVY